MLKSKFIPVIVKEIIGTNLYALEDFLNVKKERFHAKDTKSRLNEHVLAMQTGGDCQRKSKR